MKNINIARRVKGALIDAINSVIKGWTDNKRLKDNSFTRSRKLPLFTMILLFLTMKGGTLDKELHDANIDVSKQSFSKRRQQIPPRLLHEILWRFNEKCEDTLTFRGYHVYAVDGTCINIAHNPKAETYIPPRKGATKGYNQLHANPLYDVLNKVYLDAIIQPQPKQDEIGALLEMMKRNAFPEKSLIIADRGYESYNVIAHFLADDKAKFLIRLKQNKTAMRDVQKLPMESLDRDLTVTVTTTQTKYDKENHFVWIQTHSDKSRKYSGKTRGARWDFDSPYKLTFRIVRVMLESGEYETLATNLPREEFSQEDIKALYHERWGIETSFRSIKYDLGLTHLHGKSDRYARQEIYAAMIFYNFVSRIIASAKAEPKHGYERRINRARASDLCRDYLRRNKASGVKLIKEIEKHTEPVRLGRKDTRNLQAKGFAGFGYRVP